MDLNGAHVLVTGGSRGIGEALAREFARAGATVSVAARSEAELKQVASDIGGHAFVVDLLDSVQVDELIERVEAEAGPIDVLVNNAGLDTDTQHAAVDVEFIRSLARVNFETPLILTRQVLRGMHQRGRGHLVFVSSQAGAYGVPGMAAYSGSKAGINNFASALHLELAQTNIGLTTIAPGAVDTAMWDAVENSNYNSATLKRYRKLQLLTTLSPEKLARLSIAAIQKDRRHVRRPRRVLPIVAMPELPRRIAGSLMAGIKLDAPPPPDVD